MFNHVGFIKDKLLNISSSLVVVLTIRNCNKSFVNILLVVSQCVDFSSLELLLLIIRDLLFMTVMFCDLFIVFR